MDASAEKTTVVPFGYYLPILLVAGLMLNVLGGLFAGLLNGLLFLDTLGTALVAVAAGPWWGAAIGALTNLILSQFPCKQQYFNYLVVNVLCGIMWGYLGRDWPGLFRTAETYKRLFFTVWFTGIVVGLVSAIFSLLTTFNFVWYLSDVDPETFRRWHLTDEYYRWLLKDGVVDRSGTILQVMVRDVIAILPDKVVSIALASFLIYYALPPEHVAPRSQSAAKFTRADLFSKGIFIAIYGFCFVLIMYRGNLSIDPSTCLINGSSRHLAQIVLWSAPLLFCLYLLIRHARLAIWRPTIPANTFGEFWIEDTKQRYVKLVYIDILTMLAGVFSLLLAFKQGSRAVSEISVLLGDGIGILAFFGVFGFLPIFVLRLAGIDPDVARSDAGKGKSVGGEAAESVVRKLE